MHGMVHGISFFCVPFLCPSVTTVLSLVFVVESCVLFLNATLSFFPLHCFVLVILVCCLRLFICFGCLTISVFTADPFLSRSLTFHPLPLDHFHNPNISKHINSINRSASDLLALSRLGHFLKGSSAQLGVLKVKASCEKLQYYGQRMDATGQHSSISDEEAEKQIRVLLIQMRREYNEAETYLRVFYGEQEDEEGDEEDQRQQQQ